jgi:hypothetical protein
MSAHFLLPAGWAPPVGYSNGIAVTAGRIVFVAGQVGWDEAQRFHGEALVPQFEQALKKRCRFDFRSGARSRRFPGPRQPIQKVRYELAPGQCLTLIKSCSSKISRLKSKITFSLGGGQGVRDRAAREIWHDSTRR